MRRAPLNMADFRKEFISFCIDCGVLRFGSFKTKSGRMSPYFFNAGLFNTGASLDKLSEFYAKAILAADLPFDMLFGPAYKGIVLASGAAMALARSGRSVPFAYNRKEAKDHGEGGNVVGAPLAGRVLIVDDVMTAGTAARESVEIIRAAGAIPCGVAIAMDRMERGNSPLSAVQEVTRDFGIPVITIATLDDMLGFLQERPELVQNMREISDYRQTYGAAVHA
jgi:orotate phosphoribosyltransferase